jgi:hypothetical protein
MQIPAKKKQKGSSLSSLARYYIVLILKFAPRATKNLPALRDHGSPGRAVMKLAAMLVFVLFFFSSLLNGPRNIIGDHLACPRIK